MALPDNVILWADSYKCSHYLQYPPGLTKLKCYFESRGGKFERTVFFGLQYVLKRYLSRAVTKDMVKEAAEVLGAHFGREDIFNREGWDYIVDKLGGKLPVRIRAVPEGTVVPVNNVLFTVESTDERVPWVANYVETLLCQVWYPMTVATNSFHQRLVIEEFAEKTGADKDEIDFKLHDFGFRGSTSVESAGIGGMAHLAVFKGTDTLAALRVAREYYGPEDLMAGFSIPATEHSTATTWGRDGERAYVQRMLRAFPDGVLSLVSDSYDVYKFVDDILGAGEVRGMIERRKGTLVVRPDSGDPVTVVSAVLEKLGAKFGAERNGAGYKLLPSYLRVIQGDGVNIDTIRSILTALEEKGWCSGNLVFGSGGALLQKMDRDTQKCAYKCCMAVIDGSAVDVYKDPATDPGKKSKRGDVTLVKEADGGFKTVRAGEKTAEQVEVLETVFENGNFVKEWTFDEVRQRVRQALQQ